MAATRTLARVGVTAVAAMTAFGGIMTSVASAGTGTAHAMKSRGQAGTSSSSNMYYHGGYIVPSAHVYIVYWGSQWGSATSPNDASGQIPLQQSFFQHVGGSGDTWSRSTTQYCEGTTSGSYGCPSGTFVSQPGENVLVTTWFDNATAAPKRITQSGIASEAVRAASYFGISDFADDQVIVDSPSGDSESGFGTRWCAWHSSTADNGSTLAYTYMPYITDAGSSCGANFISPSNGVSGATEGVTIVGGHEYAETVTDAKPGSVIAWEDSGGGENGDKCAWNNGEHGIISINGAYFAVQSLWSNDFSSHNPATTGSSGGACVLSYTSATSQS